MSADEEATSGLVSSPAATLLESGARALAARGRIDLRNQEEAEALLREGLELERAAFNDLGWRAIYEPEQTAKRENAQRTLLAAEYLRRVGEGETSDAVIVALNMKTEEKDFALALGFFLPTSVPKLVDDARIEMDKYQSEVAIHEQRLSEVFCCFEKGLALDPNNLQLISNMANCYSVGQGIPQDEAKAFVLLHKAAEMGLFTAQTALGYHYLDAPIGSTDKDQPAYWFRKAAEQGDMIAVNALQKLIRSLLK